MQNKKSLLKRLLFIYIAFFLVIVAGIIHNVLGDFGRGAETGMKMGEEIGRPVTLVIDLEVPEAELIRRISGRRVCPKCGASYHIDTMKPKVEGICDRCGAELIQRKDDNAESFKTRLDNYYKSTQPLVDFYKAKGLYKCFDGTKPLQELLGEISAELEALK